MEKTVTPASLASAVFYGLFRLCLLPSFQRPFLFGAS